MIRTRLIGCVLALSLAAVGCGGPRGVPEDSGPALSAAPESNASEPVPPARLGTAAPSARIRFVPTEVDLPGSARAAVEPARTVGGELKVPENVRHVGWWDGSAYAGDPFGAVVIAGHVDSATEGLGYFARLQRIEKGEVVILRAGPHRQSYRVSRVRLVKKQALATDGASLDQTGPPRLVLITCGGAYRPAQGGYDSNLVITAEPVGLAS